MKYLVLMSSLLMAPLTAAPHRASSLGADTATARAAKSAPGRSAPVDGRSGTRVRVQGDVRTLPFTVVRGFPFVAAEVNGTRGRLMFDTGSQDALTLNDHLLTDLGPGEAAGRGFVGSGQSYTVTLRSKVDRVLIGAPGHGLDFADVPDIRSQDLSFLEPLTPDCLGLVGYDFFGGGLMKLDYASGRLTFYKATDKRRASRDFLKGETVLAVLPFETRNLPNHPLIHLRIGTEEFLGAFDTGQTGTAQMSAETQRALMEQHLLTPLSPKGTSGGPGGSGVMACRIEGLHLTDTLTASVSGVPVSNRPGPAAVPMGTPETNIVSLGYAFLSQYKTVWDYSGKKIYLLRK